MAYLNRLPQLSRIAQSSRNDDFIPIVGLKEFDALMADIVKKFQSTNSAESAEAANIASKLKDIEYNLADAFTYNEDGEIIGTNSHSNSDGVEVPTYGKYAMDTMLQTIDKYYNEFVSLMGNDPNTDYWKVELDKYYTAAMEEFKNKINGIFINSANAAALEAKQTEDTDYALGPAKDLPSMTAMRLNADTMAYPRNITISPVGINVPTIAFEVTELEKDTLIMNLKVQNGFMYYDLNVILDNGKWDIKCVDSYNVKMENSLFLDVYKYVYGGKNQYVFTVNTDYPDKTVRFNFEIEGLLVGGYRFNATGLNIEDHDRYYDYTEVDHDKPVYTDTYYTKDEELDDHGSVVRISYIPHENLISFLPDTVYYTRTTNFNKIKKIDVLNCEKLSADPKLSLVSDDVVYTKGAKKLHVSYEVAEAIDVVDESITNRNEHILENPKIVPDTSVRMFEAGNGHIAVANKGVRRIDNRISCGYGNTMFDLATLKPGQAVNTNAFINKHLNEDVSKRYSSPDIELENSPMYFTFDGAESTSLLIDRYNFLNDEFEMVDDVPQIVYFKEDIDPDGRHTRNLNRIIKDSLVFCESCFAKIVVRTAKTYDIIIVPNPKPFETDRSDEIVKNALLTGTFYIQITVNTPDNTADEPVLVYRSITNTEYNDLVRNPVPVKRKGEWLGAASNDNVCVLLRKNGLSYTYDGQLIYDLDNRNFVNTGTPMTFSENMEIRYDGWNFFWIINKADIELSPDRIPDGGSDIHNYTNQLYISENGFDWYLIDLQMFRAKAHVITYTKVDTTDVTTPDPLVKYFTKNTEGEYEEAVVDAWVPDTEYYHITSGTEGRISIANNPTTWDANVDMFKRTSRDNTDPFIVKTYGPDRYGFILPGYSKAIILSEEGIIHLTRWTKALYDKTYLADATYETMFSTLSRYCHITPFHVAEYFFNKAYYVFIDVDEGKIAYGLDADNGEISTLVQTWTKVAITGLTLNSLTAYDFHFEGIVDSNIILWGEGKRDTANIGWFRAGHLAPQTWTKVATITAPIKKVVASTEIYIQSDKSSKLVSEYRLWMNDDATAYISVDDGVTFVNAPSVAETLLVSNNEKNRINVSNYLDNVEVKHVRSSAGERPELGIVCERPDGTTVSLDDTHPFVCTVSPREETIGHATAIFPDKEGYIVAINVPLDTYTGSDLNIKAEDGSDTNTTAGYLACQYKDPVITEIYDSEYGIYGNTEDFGIAINKGYDEAFGPTSDPRGGTEFNTSIVQSTYGPLGFYPSTDTVDIEIFDLDKTITLNNLRGFKPNKMFVSVNMHSTIVSESKEMWLFGSEITKGLSLMDAKETIEEEQSNYTNTVLNDIDIYVQNAFETKNGLYVYGLDDNDRTSLYLVSGNQTNENGRVYDIVKLLEVDVIDFIKSIDDDIIISTYDSQAPYDKYTFDKTTGRFNKSSTLDVADVFSFNNIIQRGKDIYFINGTGSNPSIHSVNSNNVGIFKISKSMNTSGVESTDITPFVKKPGLFSGTVRNRHVEYIETCGEDELIIISGVNNSNQYKIHKWLVNFNALTDSTKVKEYNVDTADPTVDRVAYEIATIINKNSTKASQENPFGFISQKSTYKLEVFKKDLSDGDKITTNLYNKFIVDDFVFDRANNSITLKNYGISGDDRFIMSTEKIAMGKTISNGITNIAIALGEDNAFALYDSTLDTLKVCKLQYNLNGQVIRFDSNYHTVQSVIIGSSNTENTVYIIAYGRFPTVIGSSLQYNDTNTYKLFSISVEQAKQPFEYVTVTEEQFKYANTGTPRADIKNYIKTFEACKPSEDMKLYSDEDVQLQFIGIMNGIRYPDAYSIVYWDKVKHCISMYTKFISSDSLKDTSSDENGIVGPFKADTLYYQIATNENGGTAYVEFGNGGKGSMNVSQDDMYTIEEKTPIVCITNRKTINLNKEKEEMSGDLLTREYEFEKDGLLNPKTRGPYNLHIQTRLGVFRYMDVYVPGEYGFTRETENLEEAFKYGFDTSNPWSYRKCETDLWFTPENSNKSILIKTPRLGKVSDVFETFEGVFIQVREATLYANEEQVSYTLYRVDNIPSNNTVDVINITDTRYFRAMDNYYAKIAHMVDTRLGLFAIGCEPFGITTIKETLDAKKFPGKSYLFYYNGADLAHIPYEGNNPNTLQTPANEWVNFFGIFDAGDRTFAISVNRKIFEIKPSDAGTGFTLTDVSTEFASMRRIDGQSNSAVNILTSETAITNLRKTFNRKSAHAYPVYLQDSTEQYIIARPSENSTKLEDLLFFDMVSKTVWNVAHIDVEHPYKWASYPGVIRTPALKSDKTYEANDLLNRLISMNIPSDKNLRAYGFVVYNNLKINIDGIRIVTDKTYSGSPVALVFDIDRNFRFNKDVHDHETIDKLFGDGRIYVDVKNTNILHKANFDIIY